MSGIDFIADLTGLAEHLAWADLVITGEGSFDRQSLRGKAPLGVIDRTVAAGVPAVVVAGRVQMTSEQLQRIGIRAWASAEDAAPELQQARGPSAAHWVREATRHALHDLGRDGVAKAPGSRPARAGAPTDPD